MNVITAKVHGNVLGNVRNCEVAKMQKTNDLDTVDMHKKEKLFLSLRQIDQNQYRIYNNKTGRFHDLELGIDVVI